MEQSPFGASEYRYPFVVVLHFTTAFIFILTILLSFSFSCRICTLLILGPTAVFRGQLSRSSLGQLANIGDLYDARTDHFTGHSVITGSTECLNISNMPMESYREEFLIDSTSYDRLALLVNDRDLQLSVAIGLVEPERNIAGLIDQDDIILSPKNGIILRTVTTLLEQVHSIADIKHLVAACDLTNSEATHVVVGVVWGATVAVCLDHTDIWSEQTEQDDLRQQLQKLMSALKSGA